MQTIIDPFKSIILILYAFFPSRFKESSNNKEANKWVEMLSSSALTILGAVLNLSIRIGNYKSWGMLLPSTYIIAA